MASTTSDEAEEIDSSLYSISPNDTKESIQKTGAYVKRDASAGDRVMDFIKQLPIRQPEGLEFCAQNSFYDKNVRNVIESSIDQPHWGFTKQYSGEILRSDSAYFFVQGPQIRAIYVLLFTANTQFILFEGSHNKNISGKEMSAFGIFTLPHDKMDILGITRVQYDMTDGGFALIDGRVGWTLLRGQQIAIGYASVAEIAHWGVTELADTPSHRDKVAELNRNGIKTKFIFVRPQTIIPNAQA